MNVEEVQKLAEGLQAVCREAKESVRDKLYYQFARENKEPGSAFFTKSNYIIDCDGDLYFLKKWADEDVSYWRNKEVAAALWNEKDYAYTTARRIKLDGTLSAKETEIVMVVDGWEDEEAGYLDYHFVLDEAGVEL